MAENLYSKGQRITTDKFREGYDRIFKKKQKSRDAGGRVDTERDKDISGE